MKRDIENRLCDCSGGVCAGIAKEYDCEVKFVRIGFVALALCGWGLPVILYLLMWAFLDAE